ncbi:MAG: O-methyltransferase [Planctomycetota bacterium]|jgi:predicted O-methyltransferase YrrM|nr:O-methyltransferase [Planctomycetota bacterium]
MTESWTAVDALFQERLLGEDPILAAVLERSAAAGLPAISVSPCQGALLRVMAQISGAQRILEVGTLGGYSTICLARGLAADGMVYTLEANPKHAAVASENIAAAGCAEQVEICVGDAAASLAGMVAEGVAPFDLVFIDADKASMPIYLAHALQLSRPGTVVIADNVVRGGAVADAERSDPDLDGVRRYLSDVGANGDLLSTAIQTVGSKGYDGLAISVVR